jgi:hypothetical protein
LTEQVKQRTTRADNRWLALVLLCMGELMIVLDPTIVNVALPFIRVDLGFTATSLAWVVNAYLRRARSATTTQRSQPARAGMRLCRCSS